MTKNEQYNQAVEIVTNSRVVSVSTLQRRIGISFTRAYQIIIDMEDNGVISARNTSNYTRQVLAPKTE